MRVTDKMTMVEYDAWTRRELPEKIPSARSRDYRRRAGDSMYDFGDDPPTRRRDGFHVPEEMGHDLSGVYTLLSDHFYYFGAFPVEVPEHPRPVIHLGRGHKSAKKGPYVEDFVEWITTEFEPKKLYGMPQGMPQTFERVEIGRKP
jgi:Nucleotide modification associated domain 2